MNITVDKNLKTPLYWQIAGQIKEKILSGEMGDGAYLPSERRMANFLGVHRNTIIKAYGELKGQELIESVVGVGYRVTLKETATERSIRPVNWGHVIKDEYIDIEDTFDNIFQRFGTEGEISLSVGMPPNLYKDSDIANYLTAVLSENKTKPTYLTPYQGDEELRNNIIAYLRNKGIRVTGKQVQVLSETNQAFDFIITAMLKPGDKVIIEEPVSPDVYRILELAGCKAITIPVDEDGMICDNLEAVIEAHHPKFIYVNSSFHDPTGATLSMERREKLIELSNTYRLPIVEEDAASELYFGERQTPTLKSMDKNNNVIYIYSFALTFIPGISLAFVAGSETLIKSLSYLVSVRMMNLDWITQKIISKCMGDGMYLRKAREIAAQNKVRMEAVCHALDGLKHLGVEYKKPSGGVYVWCKLPTHIDSKKLMLQCRHEGVLFLHGEPFYPHKNGGKDHLRINYSYESLDRIEAGMRIFCELVKKYT